MNGFKFVKNYSLSLTGLIISIVILLLSTINNLDIFESVVDFLSLMERYEIDEFIIPLFVFLVFTCLDLLKRQKQNKINQEKLSIYKAMLSSSHHVINNFLNQMQIFKITAEDTPEFDPDILKLYEEIIEKASEQIDSLGSITSINEESIFQSVAPKASSNTINK